jgi:hypothetical protein
MDDHADSFHAVDHAMTQSVTSAHHSDRTLWPRIARRLRGPGGLYNIGNALGLTGGITLAIATAKVTADGGLQTGLAAAADYLAGSASAICITLAMLIFFWGGEVYHRAWAHGFPPDDALNRRGDLLSGWGALVLGAGLFMIGQPMLAATAGLLHAIGKFGSALQKPDRLFRPSGPDPFRLTVLASRAPALVLVLGDIAGVLRAPGGGTAITLAPPVLLLTCYVIWARADILLFKSA